MTSMQVDKKDYPEVLMEKISKECVLKSKMHGCKDKRDVITTDTSTIKTMEMIYAENGSSALDSDTDREKTEGIGYVIAEKPDASDREQDQSVDKRMSNHDYANLNRIVNDIVGKTRDSGEKS